MAGRQLITVAIAALAATASFLVGADAWAQPHTRVGRDRATGLGQTQDVIREPRFIVEAVSFKALDESGPNSPGADEVFAIFRSGDQVMATQVYENVDTGEDARLFEAHQSCIWPAIDPDGSRNGRWGCAPQGASGPVRFDVALHDLDPYYRSAFGAFCVSVGDNDVESGSCGTEHSTVVFRHSFTYEVSQILARLDARCRCFTETARYTETHWYGDTVYDFTLRITRVDDGRDPPAVERDPEGLNQAIYRSGALTAMTGQGFELDAGAIVAAGADFAFSRAGSIFFLTPGGGAKIWLGGSTARGYAACFAQRMSANYVTTQVNAPAVGAYACYVTNDGRVGEFHVDSFTPGVLGAGGTLGLSYTTWQ